MRLRMALLLLVVLPCAGCVTLPSRPGCVKIGPAGAICLLPPAALPAVQAQHVVRVGHDGKQETFLGRLSIDASALRLAGASLFGTHLFTISWDGASINATPANAKLRPDLVLAMLETALADPALLRPQLYGLTLKQGRGADGGEFRELHEHGHLVTRIEISGTPLAKAHLRISVPPAHLTLDLVPMSEDGEP